jgi:long-chain acyl-CoA synthetase
MAEKSEKFAENVPGAFYVDRACIACISCVSIAPKHFSMQNGNEHSMVLRQPETAEELRDCLEALAVCPVNAIGQDGEASEQPHYIQLLLHSLRKHAELPALIDSTSKERLSYARLSGRLGQACALLKAQQVEAGEVVALIGDNSLDMACLMLASMAWGAVAMPLNPRLAQAEFEALLKHAQAKLLLGGEAGMPLDSYLRIPALPEAEWQSRRLPAESGALLIYSSGSTGTPKGVLLSHSNLASNVLAAQKILKMDAEHPTLCLLPLFHSFGFISDFSTALLSGASCTLVSRFEPARMKELEEAIHQGSIRSFSAVPLIFDLLLRLGCALEGSKLRFVVSGGAPLKAETQRSFRERFGVPVLGAYGLSEATCFCSLSRPESLLEGSAGEAVAEIEIVDEEGLPLPPGEKGEILIKGPGLMQGGYFKDARAAWHPLREGWFPSGDLGFLDAEGRLFISGRKKNMVIRGGEKIYLEDVDAALKAMPGVLDCASVRLDGKDIEKFASFVVVGSPGALSEASVLAFLRGRLAAAKCPDYVFFSQAIPRGATNKVRLKELQELALGGL